MKSSKVWHNLRQNYNYLNVNGQLSGNKLHELQEKKWIICYSSTVETEDRLSVRLCPVQMCEVQMWVFFIDG